VPACVEQISCHVLQNFNLTLLQNHPGKLALSMHRVNSKISRIVILGRSVEEGEVDREHWLRLGSIVFRQKKPGMDARGAESMRHAATPFRHWTPSEQNNALDADRENQAELKRGTSSRAECSFSYKQLRGITLW
jgi:hypothetical protein